METNLTQKKKAGTKTKKTASAREQKQEAIQRNINAAMSAVATYRKKKAS